MLFVLTMSTYHAIVSVISPTAIEHFPQHSRKELNQSSCHLTVFTYNRIFGPVFSRSMKRGIRLVFELQATFGKPDASTLHSWDCGA